jgi:hypothetical protein
MKYFAKIDENNNVENVIVVKDEELINNGTFGDPSKWIQTWRYDGTLGDDFVNGNPAAPGSRWLADEKRFIEQSPFPSWVLDKSEKIWKWVAPVPYPNENRSYTWDEPTTSWLDLGASCCDDPNLRQ